MTTSPTTALADLQRDWIDNWPRYWPDRSYAHRCGFQAGVNKRLGRDAVHVVDVPKSNPYDSGSSDNEAWDDGFYLGQSHASILLDSAETGCLHG